MKTIDVIFKRAIAVAFVLVLGVAEAANPIIKGVFVNSTTGAYLKGPVYVSKNGNDSNDGTSWAKAKLTIQAGVVAANAIGDGTTVLVGPGTYSDSTTSPDDENTPTVVNISSKKLYLKSSEGKAKTIILGQHGSEASGCGAGARRCIYASPLGTVVDGFTLKNGATVATAGGNNSANCGGGMVAFTDGYQQPAKGWVIIPQVWIVNSDVINCRANHGAAFGRGVLAINCYVSGCKTIDPSAIVGYRSYNYYNCIFEGNGTGSGAVLSHACCSSALNCTFIGNFSDTSYGVNNEMHYMYNCAMINNQFENASDPAKCYVKYCVTTSANALYGKTTEGCIGKVSRFQVHSPLDGDYHPVKGSKLIGAASKDLISVWGANWVPSDFIGQDFYGNPRPYGASDSVDVGAVQSAADPVEVDCGFVTLGDANTIVKFKGKTRSVTVPTYGTSWFALDEHPLEQLRFMLDRKDGESVYAYEMSGYKLDSNTEQYKIHLYPDSREDEGVYANPPNPDIPGYMITAKKASDIKWCDPTLGDYTGANGSEAKPYETIQQAVDAVTAGGVVYAKPGVYNKGTTIPKIDEANDGQDTNTTPNRVYINKPMRLASTDGAAVTIIEGAHDNSAKGAYGGCGPKAVRCVLVRQGQWSAVQGFTLKDGATDGDLANRGRWDVKDSKPRFNSSDYHQRGNFGGGGFRAHTYTYNDYGVLTDSIITNCTAYWGGAVYGGVVKRCQIVGNTAVDCDPGSTYSPYGVTYSVTMVSCIVRGNSVSSRNLFYLTEPRFTTFYQQDTTGLKTYNSMLGDKTTPTVMKACGNPAKGDFRVRSSVDNIYKPSGTRESAFVKYSSSDFYGRSVIFRDKEYCLVGAVQELLQTVTAKMNIIGAKKGGVEPESDATIVPGESLTINAKDATRNLIGFKVIKNGEEEVLPAGARTYTWSPTENSDTLEVKVEYATDWYVDAKNGSDKNKGFDLSTAKRTLAGIMDSGAVISGDTVWAAPGEYKEGVMTNTVDYINSGTARIPSRVVVPWGVTLKSISGNYADTKIFGKWHSATDRQGDNAMRAVYLYTYAVIDGFTITDGATKAGGGVNEFNCGGGVAAPVANREDTAYIRNCYITRCGARSGAAGIGGIYENCKADKCIEGSDGMFYYEILKNCYIDGSDDSGNQSILRQYYGVYNCTIYTSRLNGDPDFNAVDKSGATIENSIIWYVGNCPKTKLTNAKNCIVYPHGNITIDNATCKNIILEKDLSKVCVSSTDMHLKYGSLAIDKGDTDLFTTRFGTNAVDLDGVPRPLNMVVDIGAYEYDWRPEYEKLLLQRGSSLKIVSIDSQVKRTGETVEILEGELSADWNTRGNKVNMTIDVVGEGSLFVYRDGKVIQELTHGKQTITIESEEKESLKFVYVRAPGDERGACLSQFGGAGSSIIVFR